MEQHRTRSAPHPQRPPAQRGHPATAPGPASSGPAPQGGGRPAFARRLPRPRLTGLGGGLFACAAMALVGGIVWLLFDSSLFVYGLLFLPVAAATALWVRPADLITAPIAAPIAFAAGVWPVAGGSGGFGGQLMGLVSALSLHAGWLYAGTLIAALIAVVRKSVLIGRRRLPRRIA
ncbi:DUF6542 domain-containing protein [Streptomyces sp. NPDC060031]|uniref:DUF6542 domain-containing protein n=1 Tax=Streptomyces sp. NPDC060031 TaxID=3347043 RepID=UPI0036894C2F